METILIQEAPTRVQGQKFALQKLTAGARSTKRTFPGNRIIGQHRKQFIVTNHDTLRTVYLGKGVDATNSDVPAIAAAVLPNSSFTIFTNDDITLFLTNTDADVQVTVTEVFYL